MSYKINRLTIHNYVSSNFLASSRNEKKLLVTNFVAQKFNCSDDEESKRKIKSILDSWFFNIYFSKWQEAYRCDVLFRELNKKWLDAEKEFVFGQCSTANDSEHKACKRGRPKKSFPDSCVESKRKKARKLMESTSTTELLQATAMSFRSHGNKSAAKLVQEIQPSSPDTAKKILHSWRTSKSKQPQKYTPEEAVSLIISNNFTKMQYLNLRKGSNERNHDLYPSYEVVCAAKKEAYPPNICINESKCEVPLQSLLHHTCSRLIKYLKPSFLNSSENTELTLISKWGFDGSAGYSEYKQQWTEGSANDSNLFITCMVPLQLKNQKRNEVIWNNPRPSSTRFCRPIRLQWIRETDDISRAEKLYLEKQIAEIQLFVLKNCRINFSLCLTMIDGKVCNSITESTSMTCYICKAKITQLNDLDSIMERTEDKTCFQYGLSTLHAYIKFLECLLHIAYRLDFKTWKAKKKDGTKDLLKKRKKEIQNKFKIELGLKIEVPKQGFGTSNDGNTARRFFDNSAISSKITGIDMELIQRVGVILKTMATRCKINSANFKEYALQTARLYVKLYPWYYMPPSVHKILIHGSSVVNDVVIPIGQLSEEALEANHKICKKFRRDFARKNSRIATNTDLFNRLLLASDPLISLCDDGYNSSKKRMSRKITPLLA